MPVADAEPTTTLALTNAQRLLWTAEALTGSAPIYNMTFAFVIRAAVDEDRFEESLRLLVAEADTMRMIIDERGDEPTSHVLPNVDFELEVVDFSGEQDPTNSFLTWAETRTRREIDTSKDTFDTALFKLGPAKTGWYFSQHHLLADAWGFSILFRRLAEIYETVGEGGGHERSPLQPFTETASPGSSGPDGGSGHNRTKPVPLYGWRRGTPATTANERFTVDLGVERIEALHRLLERPGWESLTHDLGVFRVLSTALFAFLHRISGVEDISIGAPVHNRPSARHRMTPGLFTEVFPLTSSVDPDDTFELVHSRVIEETDRFLRSSGQGLSTAAENRNLNVILNYLPIGFGQFDGAPVESHWIHSGHVEPDHQLRVHVTDFDSSGSLRILFDCNEQAIPDSVRRRVPEHFLSVLDSMISDPSAPIAAVRLAEPAERSLVLTRSAGPKKEIAGTVLDWIEDQFEAKPDHIAMSEGNGSWTYAELADWTLRLAAGLPRSATVGICLPRSAGAVAAMLAVLRSGSAYVPIDPTWPAERIGFVVGDAGCSLVIGSRPAGVDSDVEFVSLEDLARDDAFPLSPDVPHDVAYVLYTSGSTGSPKGVEVAHSSLANYVSWAMGFYGHGLVFPLYSPLTFDLTVTSIFAPLCSGGSIRVYGETPGGLDLSIRDVVEENEADIVKLTPSHLALLIDMDLGSSRVKQLILGGEDLSVSLARRAHARFGGDVEIHNEYGPTEATVGCVVHTFDPGVDIEGSVPIGQAIDNMRALVLGPSRDILPFGVPGRLWVSGSSVANGYVNRPQLTAERFRALPDIAPGTFYDTGDLAMTREDGTIEYLGRTDDQVKVRGARIELGEIETALADHPNVISAVASVNRRETEEDDGSHFECLRCGLPDNYPGAAFDRDGICNQCRAFEEYRKQAETYFKSMSDLEEILKRARAVSRSEYDCISLLSGGKDSTYALAKIVDMGARPLAFTLDNGYISEEAKANIRRVTEALGVDHVFGSTPSMDEIFVDSLQRHANVCNGCFKTIYTLSMELAREKGIPLIVTGLSRGQFFETRLTGDLFREPGITSEEIDARVLEARKAYHKVDDAPRRLLNVEIFESDDIFEDIHFADFYRYCDVGLEEMLDYLRSRLPWIRPADTGRSTNCLINDVGIFVHKRERGFHNYALPYSWDVRLGHKTRSEALAELDDDIDVARVQQILGEIGYPDDVTTVGGGSKLVAYYTSDRAISPADLKSHLAKKLPAAMMPAQFVALDEIPMTSHGKADRGALPDPSTVRPDLKTSYVAPRNALEHTLARTWAEVLGIDEVGVEDDFFDLGGDSIMALQIVSRLRRAGVDVALRDLFSTMTVAGMARHSGIALPGKSRDEPAPTADDESASQQRSFADVDEEQLRKLGDVLRSIEE